MPPASSSASASASASVRDFLVQQELPENPLQHAQDSLRAFEQEHYHHPDTCRQQQQQQQQHRRGGGGCSCPHWRDVLPQELDLSFCPVVVSTTKKKPAARVGVDGASEASSPTVETTWMVKNPVHALHLQSLLDEDAATIAATAAADSSGGSSNNNNNNNNNRNTVEPVLYGAEQERLVAVKTEGLAESWHPWMEPSDPPPPPIATVSETNTANSNHHRAAMAADSRSASSDATPNNNKNTQNEQQQQQQQHSATLSSVVQQEQQPQQSSTNTAASAATTATTAPLSSTATTKPPGDSNPLTTTKTTTTTLVAPISSTSNASVKTAAAEAPTATTVSATSSIQNNPAATAAAATVPKECSASASTTTSTTSKPAPASLSTSTSTSSPLSASNLPPSTSPLGAPPSLALFGAAAKPVPPPPPQSAVAVVASNTSSTNGAAQVVPDPSSGRSSTAAAPAASPTTTPAAAASGTNSKKAEPDQSKPEETASATTASTNQAAGSHKQPQEQEHSDRNNDKNDCSLSEDHYMALHAAEEQILKIRHRFLSKRRSLVAPTPSTASNKRPKASSSGNSKSSASKSSKTSGSAVAASNRAGSAGADKKRKVDSGGSGGAGISLQAMMMTAWKLPQQHPSHSNSKNNNNNTMSNSAATMDLEHYTAQQQRAERTVAVWMEHFRWNRQAYWREQKLQQQQQQQSSKKKQQQQPLLLQSALTPGSVFGAIVDDRGSAMATTTASTNNSSTHKRCCQECHRLARQQLQRSNPADDDEAWLDETLAAVEEDCTATKSEASDGDLSLLFQCLECSFVGCSPASVAGGRATKQHMVQHLVQSNHKYAVSCGQQAQIYCLQCGDFVQHPIFDQEKERIDLTEQLPWQAWKEHAVQRSFDALQFFRVQDQGVFWRGMVATYPPLVPKEHVRAARACLVRQQIFRGELDGLLLATQRPEMVRLGTRQQRFAPSDRWRVPAPVGMYNLGLSCFMSSILQCLIHCVPLQRYFLKDTGHNHEACALYRKKYSGKSVDTGRSKKTTEIICLACEMDKLFLRYMGSAIGVDVFAAVRSSEAAGRRENTVTKVADGSVVQGDPLITATMLSTAWKCGGLKHLAGYGQRDAHEFLHGFLEFMGRHVQLYRTRMYRAINAARPANSFVGVDAKNPSQFDEIKTIFEGTLRSVLVCLECGTKRFQSEPFMSISLPLSKEVQNAAVTPAGIREKLSVELCLRHFTMPEMLADPVVCQTCGKKTPTKKQHVVSKLPKILCLHLKRFDASLNRKIEDFVAFPSKGLNMGQYLPHWCEVSRVPTEATNVADDASMPQINYDLFGTVNHYGNLQSGHYVTNLKVKDMWFHCNDAHVAYAGVGNGEAEVLKSEGAYLLFYERR